jgi:hypothetical protein
MKTSWKYVPKEDLQEVVEKSFPEIRSVSNWSLLANAGIYTAADKGTLRREDGKVVTIHRGTKVCIPNAFGDIPYKVIDLPVLAGKDFIRVKEGVTISLLRDQETHADGPRRNK